MCSKHVIFYPHTYSIKAFVFPCSYPCFYTLIIHTCFNQFHRFPDNPFIIIWKKDILRDKNVCGFIWADIYFNKPYLHVLSLIFNKSRWKNNNVMTQREQHNSILGPSGMPWKLCNWALETADGDNHESSTSLSLTTENISRNHDSSVKRWNPENFFACLTVDYIFAQYNILSKL